MLRFKFEINALTLTILCTVLFIYVMLYRLFSSSFVSRPRFLAFVCSVTFYFTTICINLSSLNIRTHVYTWANSRLPPQIRATTHKKGGKIAQNHFILFFYSIQLQHEHLHAGSFFLGRFSLCIVKLRNVTTFECWVRWCEWKAAAAATTMGNKLYIPSIKKAEE